jgi:DNA-binding LytR/AlgR family response regulator
MIRIAVAEDDAAQREMLCACVREFMEANGEQTEMLCFEDGADLLEHYPAKPDLLLMDIDMPRMDGLEAARRVRESDSGVLLVFVTNLIQYALAGYAVDAMDFVVKPVTASGCRPALERALKRIRQKRGSQLTVRCRKNRMVVNVNEILYAETQGRALLLHLKDGEMEISESIQSFEERTRGLGMFRCHGSFLVNLAAVDRVGRTDAVVAGASIPVSKYRRSEFLQAMAAHMGGV